MSSLQKYPVQIHNESQLVEYEHKLTDMEIQDRGGLLAQLEKNFSDIDTERKDAAASFKAKLNEIKSRIAKVALDVRNGFERNSEECDVDMDFAKGICFYVSIETGEIVHQREITKEERQLCLFGGE